MRRAIALARRGEGLVEPNPLVGCVLARSGRVISEGFHRRFGMAHAEINALASCRRPVRGATAYVSLEPCCHHGKTPPCCDALIEVGVGRVVVGTLDPNPQVSGKGVQRLRSGGVVVDVGVCEEEARLRIAPFATRILHDRPYVIAKWAQTLDGKIATVTGDSKWISCENSRKQVHRLRGRVDVILVGVGTVLADDPMLTARGVRLRRVAVRVVLDTQLRTPLESQLVRSVGSAPTVIMTTTGQAKSQKARRLSAAGVEVVGCRSRGGLIDVRDSLGRLARRDATNILVEGGSKVLSSFFSRRLIDEAYVYVAPAILGGEGAPSVSTGRNVKRIAESLRPNSTRWRRCGDDMCAHLRFNTP